MGTHHLLCCDHHVHLPARRGNLPKVARWYHARLPNQIVSIIPYAEEVGYVGEVVGIVQRISVGHMNDAVLLAESCRWSGAFADVRLDLANRPFVVRGLALDVPWQVRRMECGKHVAEVWPKLFAELLRLVLPCDPLPLLHRKHQGDLLAAQARDALRHEGEGEQAQHVRGLVVVGHNHKVLHPLPLPDLAGRGLLGALPLHVPVRVLLAAVSLRPAHRSPPDLQHVQGTPHGDHTQEAEQDVVPPLVLRLEKRHDDSYHEYHGHAEHHKREAYRNQALAPAASLPIHQSS
mmetsp:Transcript_103855/g.276372  ORF Transcript_103855/g.276372 Transcript_103855/m.276372 type:complete len:291 (+) Transcript_103855:927-1799(+)